MEKSQELKHVLTYIQSELNRMETMAGTLSSIEQTHYDKLTNFDDSVLHDIAVEEQSAARQLSTMKQMCLTMSRKIDHLQQAFEREEAQEWASHAETH